MQGKICLVTGATAGIGLVAARELARKGASVVLVGRNQAKTEELVRQIRQETKNPNVSSLIGDLSRLQEVRRVAEEFKAGHDRLDVLLNNAGAIFPAFQKTADGLEMTFALNHMSYFLLTRLLLDLLKKSAPSRVINVSSGAHRGMRLDFDDLQAERGYHQFWAYGRSKLANLLFTYELARRLQGTGVTANAVHPGTVASDFGDASKFLSFFKRVFRVLYLTSEQGAQTLIHLASAPEVAGVSGEYFYKKRAHRSSAASRDPEAAGRLWRESERLCGVEGA